MGDDLKVGDRVHLTSEAHVLDYRPGDKGRIVLGPAFAAGEPYYVVEMDKGESGRRVICLAEEIEPDV